MEAFLRETGIAAPLEGRNVDTDQIIPARFLKTDRAAGYGRLLFHDRRFDDDGDEAPDFVLNRPPFREARILVADVNFGCGSSREGAVYALHDFGIRAVIAPSFGDIFYNNALKNGLVPVRLDEAVVTSLRKALSAGPEREVTVDLEALAVTVPGGMSYPFGIDPFWRDCLMKGVDEIEMTRGHAREIAAFEDIYLAEAPWVRA